MTEGLAAALPGVVAGYLVAVAILAAAASWGWPLARRLLGETPRAAAFSVLLGLLGLADLGRVLGALGALSRGALLVAPVALLLLGGESFARALRRIAADRLPGRGVGTAVGVALVPLAAALLFSPVACWDTRVYHLGLPEAWLATGEIIRDPRFPFSFYPSLGEWVFLYSFLAPDPDAAAIVLALAPLGLAGVLLGGGTGLWLTLAGTPAIAVFAALPKSMLLLAAATAAACAPWLGEEKEGEPPSDGAAIASGLALGVAMAVHYAAIFIIPLAAQLWLRRLPRRGIALAAAAAALAASPAYLQNLVETGNPVHPFMEAESPVESTGDLHAGLENAAHGWWEPFNAGSTWGFLLPLGIAGALLRGGKDRGTYLVAAATLLAVTLLEARPRYAVGATLVLAHGAGAFWRGRPRAAAVLGAIGFLETCFIVFLIARASPFLAAGPRFMPRDAFLEGHVPEIPLARWASANLPPRAVVATLGVARTYGWAGRLEAVSEYRTPRAVDALRAAADGADAAKRLRAQGFAFLVFDPTGWERFERQDAGVRLGPAERDRLAALLDASRLVREANGVRLYALP